MPFDPFIFKHTSLRIIIIIFNHYSDLIHQMKLQKQSESANNSLNFKLIEFN